LPDKISKKILFYSKIMASIILRMLFVSFLQFNNIREQGLGRINSYFPLLNDNRQPAPDRETIAALPG